MRLTAFSSKRVRSFPQSLAQSFWKFMVATRKANYSRVLSVVNFSNSIMLSMVFCRSTEINKEKKI